MMKNSIFELKNMRLTYTRVNTVHRLKCHVHNKLTGLRRVYVGISFLFCIINLLIAPVDNVLMRLGCKGKGTEDFSKQ